MPRRLFGKEELERIEARIAEVEAHTSGEIVTMVVRASSDYLWVRWLWAGIGAVLGSVAIVAVERAGGRPATVLELLETQAVGAVFGAWLSLLPPLRRLMLPRRQTAWRVHGRRWPHSVRPGCTRPATAPASWFISRSLSGGWRSWPTGASTLRWAKAIGRNA